MNKGPGRFDLKTWEKGLLVVAALLFCVSLGIFITDYPLLDLLFGLEVESKDPIGRVSRIEGSMRREKLGQAEFRGIGANADVFPRDVIVTSADSRATLTLEDGSVIELAPSTMIRLENENLRSLTGISHVTKVQVVSGEVEGKSSPDSKSAPIIVTRNEEVKLSGRKKIKANTAQPMIVAKPMPIAALSPIPVAQLPAPRPSLKPVVVAEASPTPSPSPSPTPTITPAEPVVTIITPQPGTSFNVAKYSQQPGATIPIQVGLKYRGGSLPQNVLDPSKKPLSVRVRVSRLSGVGKDGKPTGATSLAMEETVTISPQSQSNLRFSAKSPGQYKIDVLKSGQSETKSAIAHSAFVVAPEYEGIHVLQPEPFVKRTGHDDLGREAVKLSWNPYPGATSYKLKTTKPGKAPEEVSVTGTEYTAFRSDISDAERTYVVSAQLVNDWTVLSAENHMVFNFTPPLPVTPVDTKVIDQNDNMWDGNGVLLTWQKTGIGDGYDLLIGDDPAFHHVIVKRRQPDNFIIFRPANRDTTYYWQVRAVAGKEVSKASRVFSFSVKRRGQTAPASTGQKPSSQ